jgi:hypothetical protein
MTTPLRTPSRPDRRAFLQSAGGTLAAAALASLEPRAAEPAKRLKVAAVFTEFRFRSHAHDILENFLEPYYFNGKVTDPGCDVVSFYADQFPENDMARPVAKEYKIPLYPSIAEALCRGGKDLAVDAVLCIGEHGTYPRNAKGQTEYPRKRFFDEVVKVFKQSGRVVPVFNDKHLSWNWDWAREMYDTAREMKIPLMASSSVPLAQRVPPFELPAGAKIKEAVSIHGGGLDSYDFHAFEVLQSIVEARQGGETGVKQVQYLAGPALWGEGPRRGARGGAPPRPASWSLDLADAAMAAEYARTGQKSTLGELFRAAPFGLQVHYKDGLKAMVLKVGANASRWNFACRLEGEDKPRALSYFNGPWGNRNLFKALSHAIQTHFRQGRAPYPIERTLLTTGLVAAGVESHYQKDKPIDTPHLEFAYQPRDFRAMREMGASWKILADKQEPKWIDRTARGAS